MQSLIQYRKFRAAVQAQLERDKEKAQGFRHDRTDQPSAVDSPSTSTSDGSKVDLEKGHEGDANTHAREASSGAPPTAARDFQEPVEEAKEEENNDEAEDEDDDLDLMGSRNAALSRTTTQQSAGTALGNVLTGVEIRKRTTTEGGDGNVFVVQYESPDDPLDPHNWSNSTRIRCTITIAAIGFVVGYASSVDSSVIKQAAKDFGVSEVVESIATGIFLIGFGAGALIAGPFSETFGRNPVYIATLALYMIFIIASAVSRNIYEQLIFRFFAGVFGATPLTCAGGSISDLWNPLERVFMFPVFANAAFTGPLLGPVVGGFVSQYSTTGPGFPSWRFAEWSTLILSGLIFIIVVLTQPETFPPILLKWKAKHLRDLTGDERYRGSIEIRQETLTHRLKRSMYRPFLLTFREPIIMLVATYLSVIYIVLFGFLEGFVYIFQEMYGLSDGVTGLTFLSIVVGLFGASALVPIVYKWAKRDMQKIQERGGDRLPPEFRLWFSMLGGSIALPISLFWMGWTARPDISIWSPLGAAVLFGYGTLCVFITCYQYIIDSYETYAASALASITLIRYIASGAIVIGASPLYEKFTVKYTLTVFGSVAALLAPLPYVFYKYGPWIRSKSKYAINPK